MSTTHKSQDSELSGVRQPVQARSQRTLRRMEDAALELIGEGGLAEASVQAIVSRAGASVGSFYARFDSRDDLLAYVRDRVWGRARDRWVEAVTLRTSEETTGLDQEILWVCGVLLTLLVEDPVRRAFLQEDPAAREGEEALQGIVRSDLVDLLRRHRAEMAHPDPDFAVEFGLRLVLGGAREVIVGGGELLDQEKDPASRVVKELARAYGAYLRGDAARGPAEAGPPASDQIDPFDVWG